MQTQQLGCLRVVAARVFQGVQDELLLERVNRLMILGITQGGWRHVFQERFR
jgi:hypothetical protein